MFHPLLSDPKKLKDADLDLKIMDLSKKYHIAAKMGQGMVCEQISLILQVYKSDQQRRYQESMQSLAKKSEKDVDGLINVE